MRYLITGGAGSLGRALTKRLIQTQDQVLIYSRDEGKHAQYFGEPNQWIKCVIGDVRDYDKLRQTIFNFQPHIIIHAAALKRIDDLENNPDECWKTNVVGSENVCQAALEYARSNPKVANIKTMLISTDKSCQPVNVYGASKFTAERIFSHYATLADRGKIRFASVRYGNVIASRGSFIPLWVDRITKGLSVPVTHEECSRYLFTLDDAVDFILRSVQITEGFGEVFIPKLTPYKIVDVIKALEEMYAVEATHDIVGIRPGEKLHEDMLGITEVPTTIEFEGANILAVLPQKYVLNIENDCYKRLYGLYKYSKYSGEPMNTSIGINENLNDLIALIKRGLSEAN